MYFIFFRNADTYVVEKHMNTKRKKGVVGGSGRLGLACVCIYPHVCIYIYIYPKEISPEYSLEGLMLRLKLQYFGHLMQRTDSLEKTLMLGKD